jgi:hypothetical protein
MATETVPLALARNAAGELADIPHALTHRVSHDLLRVLTLLHAISNEVNGCTGLDDGDDLLTSSSSRATELVSMADEIVRSVVNDISPYV